MAQMIFNGLSSDNSTSAAESINPAIEKAIAAVPITPLIPIAVDGVETVEPTETPEVLAELCAQNPKPKTVLVLDPKDQQKVNTLVQLVKTNEKNKWLIGDMVIDLTTTTKATLGYLRSVCGDKESRLSIYRSVCSAFPIGSRDLARPFYDYEKVVGGMVKISREAKATIATNPPAEIVAAALPFAQPNFQQIFAEVSQIEATPKAVTNKKGKKTLTTQKFKKQDVTRRYGLMFHAAKNAATPKANPKQDHPILDRVFHSKNEDLLQNWTEAKNVPSNPLHDAVKDLKFQIIGADAPYGQYDKNDDGSLDLNTSAAAFADADNKDGKSALETTCKTIIAAAPFLAKGGCILLWQSCDFLRIPIIQAVEQAGLEVEITIVWDKPTEAPQDPKTALTRQSEFCFVLKHKDDKILNHDGSKRGNVLKGFWFDDEKATYADGSHIWRKPASLMEFLVKKLTYAGENVLDLFACSGSLSIAATKLNRRFVYVESNDVNFPNQSPKVLAALEQAQAKDSSGTDASVAPDHNEAD